MPVVNMTNQVLSVHPEYPKRDYVVCPRGDDVEVTFSFYDADGDEEDITSVTALQFRVSEGQVVGGNMWPGGPVLISKVLGSGVVKSANLYEAVVSIAGADTSDLFGTNMYYELKVTRGGKTTTRSAGLLYVPDTIHG